MYLAYLDDHCDRFGSDDVCRLTSSLELADLLRAYASSGYPGKDRHMQKLAADAFDGLFSKGQIKASSYPDRGGAAWMKSDMASVVRAL